MTENASSPSESVDARAASSSASSGNSPRQWTTEELLGQQREVLIRHGDDVYRLRITRHGKLILYK